MIDDLVPTDMTQPRVGRRAFLAGVGAMVVVAACSGESSSDDDATTTTAGDQAAGDSSTDDQSADDGSTSSDPAPFEGRVLLLGEEYLLANALALGVTPVASTATVADAGFVGIEGHDTSGIEVLENTDEDLESLVVLDTDVVVAAQYVVDALGSNALAPFGELTVVPEGATEEETLQILADVFGRQEQADALLADLDAARERAAEEIPAQDVSVVAIYPGPSVAVFADGPWAVPQTLLDAGCTLVPDASQEHDGQGRVYLSLENLDLIGGDTVILMTAPEVEGESGAIEEILSDPLWTDLPGPAAGRVHELNRLGYPGVEGRIRLVDDLIEILA